MAPMELPTVTNVALKLENVRILDFPLPKKELAKVKILLQVGSLAVHLRLARCTAWVKRWYEAMDFLTLRTLILNQK